MVLKSSWDVSTQIAIVLGASDKSQASGGLLLRVALEPVLTAISSQTTSVEVLTQGSVPVAIVDLVDPLHPIDVVIALLEASALIGEVALLRRVLAQPGAIVVHSVSPSLKVPVRNDDLTVIMEVSKIRDSPIFQMVLQTVLPHQTPSLIQQFVSKGNLLSQLVDLGVLNLHLLLRFGNLGGKLYVLNDLNALPDHGLQDLEVNRRQVFVR